MVISKSTRHSKIIGEFGEHFVCDSLSKSNFEVLRVDHTGIDIIAYDKTNKKRLGITVKSRTRASDNVKESVNVFSKRKNDRKKLLDACEYFVCEPWVAVYSENEEGADLYLVDLSTFDKYHGGKAVEQWKMSKVSKQGYLKDPNIKHISIKLDNQKWRF
jgi:Holliday junction resolvase-like predicted endonuclease